MRHSAPILTPPVTGGCLCGATRYVADQILWSAHCHCASCRRATGAGFASYLGVVASGLRWLGPETETEAGPGAGTGDGVGAQPVSYQSSPGTDWLRCGRCGSPLAYRADRFPGELHLLAGTLDQPERFRAEMEVNRSGHLGWTELARPAPYQMQAGDDPGPVLALIRAAFADMEGRIDPPSSMLALREADVMRQAMEGEVWLIGAEACVFLTPKPGALYIGKLATAAAARRRGHARTLIALAEARARALGLPVLELQSRIELVENHATFRAMGFALVGATRHQGYDRDTSLTFRRPVSPLHLEV